MQNNQQINFPQLVDPFKKFMNDHQGQNPSAITQQLLRSGNVTQAQYNYARQIATAFEGYLRQVFK